MAAPHLIGLIGSGTAGSLSPLLHEREAAAHGLRYAYRTLDLDELGLAADDAGQLARDAARLGFTGLNVTHPCKQTVIGGLDALSDDARALGAVNTVTVEGPRLVGRNTDHSGFRAALAEGLAGRLGGHRDHPGEVTAVALDDVTARLGEADGVVNATPVGMVGHPGTPFDASALAPRHWVADVVYRPLATQLLKTALAAGCHVLDGGWMAVAQAADAFELFTGLPADRARMRAHFLELVAEPDQQD